MQWREYKYVMYASHALYSVTLAYQSANSVVIPSSCSNALFSTLKVHWTFLACSSNNWSPCMGTWLMILWCHLLWNISILVWNNQLGHFSRNICINEFKIQGTLQREVEKIPKVTGYNNKTDTIIKYNHHSLKMNHLLGWHAYAKSVQPHSSIKWNSPMA